jgi:uncharacterized protein YkwD
MTRRILLQTALATVAHAALNPDTLARRIFDRINELRTQSGVEPLAWSARLGQCAKEQSIRKDRLRFPGHDDPERGSVSERLHTAGIPWARCGENIFSERGYADPVHYAVVSWWYSPGHTEKMRSPRVTQTGVGVAQGSDGTFFVTQIFVLPPPPAPKISRRR